MMDVGSSEHFSGLDSFCQESRIAYGVLVPGRNSGTVWGYSGYGEPGVYERKL